LEEAERHNTYQVVPPDKLPPDEEIMPDFTRVWFWSRSDLMDIKDAGPKVES